jgi:hypothetical protein
MWTRSCYRCRMTCDFGRSVLAAVLVFAIVLVAMAAVFSVGDVGRGSAWPATGAGIFGGSGCDICESQPAEGKTEPPAICRSSSARSPDALRQTDSMPRGEELKYSELSGLLAPRDGLANSKCLPGLNHLGNRQTVHLQPPLEVLFCSWQA